MPCSTGPLGRQLLWALGTPVGRAFDLIEYQSDPERFERFFEEEPYFPRLGVTLSAEAGVVTQPLETPEVFAGSLRWSGLSALQGLASRNCAG